jgi:hypothetical protein
MATALTESKSGTVYGSLGVRQSYFSESETVLTDFNNFVYVIGYITGMCSVACCVEYTKHYPKHTVCNIATVITCYHQMHL